MSKNLVAKTAIIRCVKPGRPATDKRPAVAAEFETIQPGTHFVAKSGDEAAYLIESGAAEVNAAKAPAQKSGAAEENADKAPAQESGGRPKNGSTKKPKKQGSAKDIGDDTDIEGDEVL